MSSERIESWSKLPCSECGIEGLATRSEAKLGPYVCEGCENHARGVGDGLKARDGLPYEVRVVDDDSAGLRELLADGWEPYGIAVDQREGGDGSGNRWTYHQIVHALRRRVRPEAA